MNVWRSLTPASVAQVGRAHLPFAAQHAQDRLRAAGSGAASRPRGARPRRRGSREPCAAPGTSPCRARAWRSRPCRAPMISSFSTPGQRRLGVLLHVARHHRVAPAAHGHVERRPRPPRIGQAGGEADLLDEALGLERGLDLARAFTPPAPVAVVLYRGRKFGSLGHGNDVLRATGATCRNVRCATCSKRATCHAPAEFDQRHGQWKPQMGRPSHVARTSHTARIRT